ncbi:NAD(P)-dependent oxidoreductase [Noviherbaspirillum sp. UKPF54]|uniref:NAD-dependent epimerase/dehydratase family protein n=1 Tax=Noviherbaspirillum sp. UKPF54 TaxID=2601898 RepID=UPI0011B15628|nr:NAD(P)-dependent oxidoreductase [Noviherbaspirillum sp. UKPF54]QDZ28098.1 NAD(P)-dependent oxidoreductase [Noviherbaspirillum sp. UKPF54]
MALYTVIGASGFVGTRLVAALRQDGHQVYTPQRGDIELFSRELGQVIYCAGLTADYAARPFDTVEAHVRLLSRILQEAHFSHLIYLSSTRLYDSSGAERGKEDSDLVLNPANPRHLYDLSKALGENLCLTVAGTRAAIARLSCVYDWAPCAPGFLSEWLQRAAVEKRFCLDSGTGVVRDYIHLDDVVASLRALSDGAVTGIVNVASGENVSNAELVGVFARNGWDISLSRETAPQRAARCDVARLASIWKQPRLVRDVVQSYLKEHHGIA